MLITMMTSVQAITIEENYFANNRENSNEFSEMVSVEDHSFEVYSKEQSNDENNDVKMQEISKEEFDKHGNKRDAKKSSLLSVKSKSYEFEPEIGTNNSSSSSKGYLHVTIEIFRARYRKERFQATTYFTWTQFPALHLTDVVGVYVSDGMHVDTNYSTKSETAFLHWDGHANTYFLYKFGSLSFSNGKPSLSLTKNAETLVAATQARTVGNM